MADGQQTTQSKYRKKKKPEQQPSIDPNEVRIKGNQGHVKRYVDYACSLLEGQRLPEKDDGDKTEQTEENQDAQPQEPLKFDSIVLKATGRAINKAVTTAEVVKRQISGLHQVTSLETLEITDVWEPLEQGLKEVETKRRVASITITLSRDEAIVDKNAAGYQQPLANDAMKAFGSSFGRQNPNRRRGGGRRGGGRPRGGDRRRYGGDRDRRYGGGGGGGGRRGYGGGGRRGGGGDRQYGDRRQGGGQRRYGGSPRGGGRYGGDRRYGGDNGGRYGGGRGRRGGGGGYGGRQGYGQDRQGYGGQNRGYGGDRY